MINNKESDTFLGEDSLFGFWNVLIFLTASLSCYLSCLLLFFFFETKIKIIKGQKKIQPDIACDSMADVVVCASRDSS